MLFVILCIILYIGEAKRQIQKFSIGNFNLNCPQIAIVGQAEAKSCELIINHPGRLWEPDYMSHLQMHCCVYINKKLGNVIGSRTQTSLTYSDVRHRFHWNSTY